MKSIATATAMAVCLLAVPALALGEEAPKAAPPPAEAPAAPAPAPEAAKPVPPVTASVYGFFHAAYYRNLRGFAARDYPGQANADPGSDVISARASRIGLKIGLGPTVLGARLSGVLEADFKGGSVPTSYATTTTTTCTGGTCTSTSTTTGASASSSWTSPLFRLRHAYLKAAWTTGAGNVAVIAGQDWALLSPLAPTTIAFAADQLFTSAGNLNRRAPQLKVAYESPGDVGVTAALAAISSTDGTTPVDYGSGNRARRPDVEARVSGFLRQGGKTVVEVGLSGHQNVRRYVVSGEKKEVEEWAAAADVVANLPYLTLLGEAFAGQSIDDTYAGIAPGVGKTYGGVHSRGGWVQADVKPVPLLDVLFGGGLERPDTDDLAGVGSRTKNQMCGGGLVVNASRAWRFGAEVYDTVSWTRNAKGVTTRSESVQLSFATRLDF